MSDGWTRQAIESIPADLSAREFAYHLLEAENGLAGTHDGLWDSIKSGWNKVKNTVVRKAVTDQGCAIAKQNGCCDS